MQRKLSLKNWVIAIVCLLVFVIAQWVIKTGILDRKDEVVELTYNAHLKKIPGNEHYTLYRTASDTPHSEAIFDGTYEALNITAIEGSNEIFILDASGEKYLLDARAGSCEMLLDGNPFERYGKDNAGGLCFETPEGLYFFSDTPGAPSQVERYYRSGTEHDAFLYRRAGKWGVYNRLVLSGTNVFRKPEFHYVEILPAQFDKIRLVSGDGAYHFAARKNGKWYLYDGWGRRRYMCAPSYYSSEHQLNDYSPTGAGEGEMTGSYIRNIIAVPTDCRETYVPYLRTRCTYIGDDEAGIIKLETSEDKYDRFFSPQGDYSTYPLSWDEPGISARYHYSVSLK